MDARTLDEHALRQAVGIDHAALDAVEAAFGWLEHDLADMPPIMHISAADRNGDIDVKSAYVRGMPYIAIKIASGFYDNPARGLPAGNAMMVALDSETGFCKAVLLDNGYLTDLRTGLAGAVAARHLAPQRVGTVGVIGTGVQARYQVECLALVRPFRNIVVWGRSAGRAQAYAEEMRQRCQFDVRVAESPDEVVAASQVVITATASDRPLVTADSLHRGLHITAVGSDFPGKQELDPEVLRRADRLVCDRLSQCRSNGEIQHLAINGELPPDREIIELGALTTGARQGRTTDLEITVCDLTGTGVQDTAIANLALSALNR
ncbi:MAG: ornithine cyclodeaminase family protein [Xanthomonadales bacterium]|nr:ornithine cyclodeaminase family protein [Xanthomonadales bacterium]NIX12276.1 ornithine cyclodeaminase family protein [Xanthomonadales bacterium]